MNHRQLELVEEFYSLVEENSNLEKRFIQDVPEAWDHKGWEELRVWLNENTNETVDSKWPTPRVFVEEAIEYCKAL